MGAEDPRPATGSGQEEHARARRGVAPERAAASGGRAATASHRPAPARRGSPAAGALRLQLPVRRGHRPGGGREQGAHPLLLRVQERPAGGAHRQPDLRHTCGRPASGSPASRTPTTVWTWSPTRWRPSPTTRPRTACLFDLLPRLLENPRMTRQLADLYRGYREVNVRALWGDRPGDPPAAVHHLAAMTVALTDGLAVQVLAEPGSVDVRERHGHVAVVHGDGHGGGHARRSSDPAPSRAESTPRRPRENRRPP